MSRRLQLFSACVGLWAATSGCGYLRPETDPTDPVSWSVQNTSDTTLYLALDDGETPLGASIHLSEKDDNVELLPRAGCRTTCAEGCGIVACAGRPVVRPLAPGEALLVEWNGVRWDQDGVLSCTGSEDVACVNGRRAGVGRYLATVCYARAVAPAGVEPNSRRSDGSLAPAVLSEPTCLAPIEFGYPSYDVLYQVRLP